MFFLRTRAGGNRKKDLRDLKDTKDGKDNRCAAPQPPVDIQPRRHDPNRFSVIQKSASPSGIGPIRPITPRSYPRKNGTVPAQRTCDCLLL